MQPETRQRSGGKAKKGVKQQKKIGERSEPSGGLRRGKGRSFPLPRLLRSPMRRLVPG